MDICTRNLPCRRFDWMLQSSSRWSRRRIGASNRNFSKIHLSFWCNTLSTKRTSSVYDYRSNWEHSTFSRQCFIWDFWVVGCQWNSCWRGVEYIHVCTCTLYVNKHIHVYRSVPGKRPWALSHNSPFFTILGACHVYWALTVCNNWIGGVNYYGCGVCERT